MITAENTYTKEYLEANRSYHITSSAYKNYKQALIFKLIFYVLFIMWLFNNISSVPIFKIIDCIFAVYLVSRFIACLIEIWNCFFSKKRFIPDKFRRQFVFSDDSFGMISHSENYSAERYKRYPSLHSAVEWGDWFFINFTAGEVCIIKKTDLTNGTPDDLRLLLKDKLGSRFAQKGDAS